MSTGIPPIPPRQPRVRAMAQELKIGGVPLVGMELGAKLAAVSDSLVREFVATFPRPGRMWGDPDVTAMRVMMYSAIERACRYGILDALQAKAEALKPPPLPPLPRDIPRSTSIEPLYGDDEPTLPMRRRPVGPDLGDE